MILARTTSIDDADILSIHPVSRFKANRRIGFSTEDTRIEQAILEAYDYFDGRNGWLNRAILTQSWTLSLPEFSGTIELPLPPLQSVRWVKYYDEDNVLTTIYDQTVSTPVDEGYFNIVTGSLVGYISLAYDETWPVTYTRPDAVQISFTAGYGEPGDVPRPIGKAIGLLATHFYDNPSQTFPEPRLVEVPRKILFGIERVAGLYRIANDHGG